MSGYMGNNMKPIVVDFYGLPGCGKSMVSHMVAGRLREQGYHVSEPTYVWSHNVNPKYRKICKVVISTVFGITHPRLLKTSLKLAKKNKYVKPGEAYIQVMNLLFKYHYLSSCRKKDYIVFDEGLCQSAVSLTVNSNPEECDVTAGLLYRALRNGVKLKRIYLYSSIEKALLQMEGRKTNDSRVERESNPDIRLRLMKTYQDACESIKIDKKYVICTEEMESEEIIEGIMCLISDDSYGLERKAWR